jgi:hypothetical protein
MTAEDVRKLYWAEPFLPFQLVLGDGREILVSKRQHLTISATGDRITVCPRIEDFEIIDLAGVKGVRTFGPPEPTPANGAA